MRGKVLPAILFTVAVAVVAGCSSGLAGRLPGNGGNAPEATTPAAPSAQAGAASAATPSRQGATTPSAKGKELSQSDPTYAAIQSVIQRANAAQQTAFAQGDPSAMGDTATSDYYNQMAQINSDMANSGVSSIKLVKIEWGPMTLDSPTSATATTFETWQSVLGDGSTDQSRDRNVYTLVQEQGDWKIQSDEQPDANPGGAPGPSSPAPAPRPRPTAPGIPISNQSQNWSGYEATGGSFTGVTGTWTVPESNGNGGMASGATWVGIGGTTSRDLIQAGTEETSTRAGKMQYAAWIETLPQPSRPVPLVVSPGDSVTVSIEEQGADQWLVSMKNDTTGKSYEATVQYASTLSSAEWIVEAPSAGRQGILPLDDFGTVQFSKASAIMNGKSVTPSQANARPITMADFGGSALATPSALNSSGDGFAVTRTDVSATIPLQPRGTGSRHRSGVLPGFSPSGSN